MRIGGFRIQNFRSIIDSDWQNLSLDNITALVGQNESGKSSILEALFAFETNKINPDDLRADGTYPIISISYSIQDPLEVELKKIKCPDKILSKSTNPHQRINISRKWLPEGDGGQLVSHFEFEELELKKLFPYTILILEQDKDELTKQVDEQEYAKAFHSNAPIISLFSEEDSILPNNINLKDIDDHSSKAPGRLAVLYWMDISGLLIQDLQNQNTRYVERHIKESNDKISSEFQEFWSQQIGKTSKISFECKLKNHPSTSPTPGEPYLEFWVADDSEKLYPKQRSQGVIWYLSFFLQLKSLQYDKETTYQLILIDEPGINLHAKAQLNVLKLFEDLSKKIGFIYSTHSPFLIDSEKIHRIIAVQREENKKGYSETRLLSANKLDNASIDTLTPIYTSMGLELHQNPIIQKKNNIILEEISAYYYLHGFYKLLGRPCTKAFIPAQGASKVPTIANMFLGWGLEFGVVVDGDSAGRRVYNELKRTLCQDDNDRAKKKLYKTPFDGGIENLFSSEDFNEKITFEFEIDSSKTINSEKVKENSKPLIASKFKFAVESNNLNLSHFSDDTITNIKKLLDSIDAISN